MINQFAIVPQFVLDAKISDFALRLWIHIYRLNFQKKHVIFNHELATELQRSIATINRGLAELRTAELISVEYTAGNLRKISVKIKKTEFYRSRKDDDYFREANRQLNQMWNRLFSAGDES